MIGFEGWMPLPRELDSNKNKTAAEFSPEARYLIGVSGGRDSVVLLHWLISAGYKNLVVCHLNHQLRGQSSDTDSRFVEKLVERSTTKNLQGGRSDCRADRRESETLGLQGQLRISILRSAR